MARETAISGQVSGAGKASAIPLWQRRSARRLLTAVISNTILVGIGLVIVLPISWMLAAAVLGVCSSAATSA